MKPAPFSPRTFFIAAITTIVTLTVCGWGLWSLSAAQYRHVIDGWIQEGRDAGYQITYDDRQLFGFPRRITMRFVNLRWRTLDGITFHTDDMDIVVTPWDWHIFDTKFKTHVTIEAPIDKDRALTLSGGEGKAHIRLDDDGVWRLVKVSLDDATIGLAPDYLFRADNLSASVERPEEPPKDHKEAGLTIQGAADNIVVPDAMPSPFGTRAAKFTAHMRVMGPVPDVRIRSDVDTWNKNSGIVEFDDFSLHWGALDLISKGTLGFDDDLQPEGAFAGTIGHPKETLQALLDHGFIAMHDQDMLAAVMDMFSKPSPDGSKGMALPITIQLGGLFLGPIQIFTFPQIDWPIVPPAIQ